MNNHSDTKQRLSKKKRILFSFLMIASSIIFTLLLAEVVIRIFLPQQEPMKVYIWDDKYGFIMKKNFKQEYHYLGTDYTMTVETNSLGLRGKDYNPEEFSRPDITKVLLIGDSFTFGSGVDVEDTFADKLKKMLGESGGKFIVINAGIGGFGTLQETTYARDHFSLFQPDIIVLTFCGNDPDDDVRYKYTTSGNKRNVLRYPGKEFLRNHSHLYIFLYYKFHIFVHNILLNKKAAEFKNPGLDKQSASMITEEDWGRTFGYIRSFHKDFIEYNPDGVLIIQATAPWNPNIRDHLKKLSSGKDLLYVDLYDETISLEPENRKLPYDGHWNPLIHSISAKKLCVAIIKMSPPSSD